MTSKTMRYPKPMTTDELATAILQAGHCATCGADVTPKEAIEGVPGDTAWYCSCKCWLNRSET